MPSASTKPDNKTSAEASEPFKHAIITVEKKVRNLEKRKGKLDTIRARRDEGETLNADQEEAISKYDGVLQNLELAKELHKQFMSISAEADKNQKKIQRRERVERQKHDVKQIREVLKLQSILDGMGSEEVREHFKEGRSGAPVLTEDELKQLDELYKVINPSREENKASFENQLQTSSEHLVSFIEAKDKAVVGTTYKSLKEMVDKIHDSGYFDQVTDGNEEEIEESVDLVKDDEPGHVETEAAPEILESPREASGAGDTMGAPIDISPPQQQIMSEPHPALSHTHPHSSHGPIVTDSAPAQQEPLQVPGDLSLAQQHGYPEDDSFFSTMQFNGQRAFTEIISSVQGDFNFLQDSELDLDSAHMDPAIVAAQPMASSGLALSQQSAEGGYVTATTLAYQGQPDASVTAAQLSEAASAVGVAAAATLLSEQLSQAQSMLSATAGGAVVTQQPSGTPQNPHVDLAAHSQQARPDMDSGAVPPVFSQPAQPQGPALGEQYSTQSYGQTMMSQQLQGSTQQQQHTYPDHSQLSSHHGVDQSVINSSAPDAPPAIPMPGQASLQQNMAEPGQTKEKKTFSMNPNAAMFQSMYHATNVSGQSATHSQSGDSDSDLQQAQAGDMQQDGRGYNNMQNDYQGGFGNSYGRNSSGRGGNRGRGRGGGAPNGYQRNNRGGGGNSNGGGQYGNRGGYNNNSNRNNSRGGMYQGYPPRSDYRPEGYQGVNGNGYSSTYNGGNNNKRGGNGASGGGSGGGPRGMRGGPQRGGNSRGGSRGGNNYGNSRPYQQQQQQQQQQQMA